MQDDAQYFLTEKIFYGAHCATNIGRVGGQPSRPGGRLDVLEGDMNLSTLTRAVEIGTDYKAQGVVQVFNPFQNIKSTPGSTWLTTDPANICGTVGAVKNFFG